MKWIIAFYVIGYFCSWIALAGMENANEKASFPNQDERIRREGFGFAIIHAGAISLLWPVGLPAMFCVLGFGQDGWDLTMK